MENKETEKLNRKPSYTYVTLPLITQPWQSDRLVKLFEIYRNCYNGMLSVQLRKYNRLCNDLRYRESRAVITDIYRSTDKKTRDSAKKTKQYTDAMKRCNQTILEYGFSRFSFTAEGTKQRKHFMENINADSMNRSVCVPMWSAFEHVLFGDGEKVKFKEKGEFTSIASSPKTGIRVTGEDGRTLFSLGSARKLHVVIGKGTKKLSIPVKLDSRDTYVTELLQNEFAETRITRKMVKGKPHWYLVICLKGSPAQKKAEDGTLRHPPGSGRVGIYIDTRYCVCATQDGEIHTFDLSDGIPDCSEECGKLLSYMDTSRRISNPGNYNADGTVKKGIPQGRGKRRKLRWTYSKKYMKAKAAYADLKRTEKEKRKLQRNILVSRILSMGSVFIVNDYPFLYAMRKNKDARIPDEENGKTNPAASDILRNAPAAIIEELDRRLHACGEEGVYRVALKNIDFENPLYREEYAALLCSGRI